MPYRNGKIVKWNVKIKGLRKLLGEDDSIENSKKVGKEIYKIVNMGIYKKHFKEYDYETDRTLDEFNNVVDCEDLNDMLSDFYDYCDANLIWIDFD